MSKPQDFNKGYASAFSTATSTRLSSDTSPKKPKQPPSTPHPSASILLLTPTNTILLLQRLRTSSSFPSAHVFPGGNLSSYHDGKVPGVDDAGRHEDSRAYRLAAVRETFEEAGLLLAKKANGGLLEVPEAELELGRRKVYAEEARFEDLVRQWGGEVDVDALIPLTRWITPPNVPKRFTTQMYLYSLPLASPSPSTSNTAPHPDVPATTLPIPTPANTEEHTTSTYADAHSFLDLSSAAEIILFPPQLVLLHLAARFFPAPAAGTAFSTAELQSQRDAFVQFITSSTDGKTPWSDRLISPYGIGKMEDGRMVLALDRQGGEYEDLVKAGKARARQGCEELVVVIEMGKGGVRRGQVRDRREVEGELARLKEEKEKGKL